MTVSVDLHTAFYIVRINPGLPKFFRRNCSNSHVFKVLNLTLIKPAKSYTDSLPGFPRTSRQHGDHFLKNLDSSIQILDGSTILRADSMDSERKLRKIDRKMAYNALIIDSLPIDYLPGRAAGWL